MKSVHSKLIILLLLPLFLGFTGFYKKTEPTPGPQIIGNPDPNVGIIVRFDSTPEMIMAESSQAIKLQAVTYGYMDQIFALGTPMTDFSFKKFSIVDPDLGFSVDKIINVQFSFNKKTNTLSGIELWPYAGYDYKPWAELKCYLDEWTEKLHKAGWERQDYSSNPFKLPSDDYKSNKEVYDVWKSGKKTIILVIQPDDYRNNYNKYNLRVSFSLGKYR